MFLFRDVRSSASDDAQDAEQLRERIIYIYIILNRKIIKKDKIDKYVTISKSKRKSLLQIKMLLSFLQIS